MFNVKMIIYGVISAIRWGGLIIVALFRTSTKRKGVPQNRKWNEKPGLSVMYQIETRPGWEWDRDFVEFNKSMSDDRGNIKFNGPYCNIQDCVTLSREIGLDYHLFEIKWHDGIAWWHTKTTKWVADKNYGKEFADLSRAAGIPFMYYYSTIFDHNPQFDSIQPNKRRLPSLIGNTKEYRDYLIKQFDEIMEQCKPDGMWFDWWWADGSTKLTWKYFREKYPETVVTFNMANLMPGSYKKIGITSGEAHRYDGKWFVIRPEATGGFPVFTSSRLWANAFRWVFRHQWEVCTPAGKWWQDPTLREDPLELMRQTTMILACGGKLCIGATSQMDGHIYPDQLKQLRLLGEWYKPRKEYFINAAPLHYFWFRPLNVKINSRNFNTVVSEYGSGLLLHLINRTGYKEGVSLKLCGHLWQDVKEAFLMPQNEKVSLRRESSSLHIDIKPEQIDDVDTIVYFK